MRTFAVILICTGLCALGMAYRMSQGTGDTPEVLAFDFERADLDHAATATSTQTLAKTLALEAPPMHLQEATSTNAGVFKIPFYSQFRDISSPTWQKVGCGITSLAMVIDYYKPHAASVDALLARGIARGAYLEGVGWTYQGLIDVAREFGFKGKGYDFALLEPAVAFARLQESLYEGPVITSVHYTFNPTNQISHLVVINGIAGDTVYYNDPAEKAGHGTISINDFIQAWKKRYVVVRPVS